NALGRERGVGRLLDGVEHDDRADRDHGRGDARNDENLHSALTSVLRSPQSICPLYGKYGRRTTNMDRRRLRSSAQRSQCCAAMRSAAAASSGALTLKKGSIGVSAHSAMATP